MYNPLPYENAEQRLHRLEQLLMQHDVDIKRLWGHVPQTMEQIGNPGMFIPPLASSSSSSSSSSGGSSSEDPCPGKPGCVTLTLAEFESGLAKYNGTWHLSRVFCDTYGVGYEYSSSDSDGAIYFSAFYDNFAERWVVQAATLGWSSEFGVAIDWTGDLEYEGEGAPAGTVTLASTEGPCPEPSSSSGGSSSGASSGASSSGASSGGSSSGGASSSGASSGGSSGGSSSGEESDPSSSTHGSSGYSWEGEASSGGDFDSGRGSEYPGEPDCYTLPCAEWEWQGGNWHRIVFNPSVCPVPCAAGCVEAPKQSGYAGLHAYTICDGKITYFEPS